MLLARLRRRGAVVIALLALGAMLLNAALGVFVTPARAAPTGADDLPAALALTCAVPYGEADGSPAGGHHAACCDVCPLACGAFVLAPDLDVTPYAWISSPAFLPVENRAWVESEAYEPSHPTRGPPV